MSALGEMELSALQPAEYSVRCYSPASTHDLNAVDAIEHKIFTADWVPKFAFAQFADIIGQGFLVAERAGEVVGFAVAALDAGDAGRGAILSRGVDPAAVKTLVDAALDAAAADYLQERGRNTAEPGWVPLAPPPGRLIDSTGEYEIRRYCEQDLAGVLEVEKAAFGDDPYPPRLFAGLADVTGPGFFVAVWHKGTQSKIVGYLLAVLDATHVDIGWVMSVAVLPEHRGQRVGFELMADAEAYLRERSCEEVVLTVDPENTVAVGLYKRRNYYEAEVHRDHHGLNLSRLVMRQRRFVDVG